MATKLPAAPTADASAADDLAILHPDRTLVIGGRTIEEMNVSAEERVRQILLNLERMREEGPKFEPRHLIANIPSQEVKVIEDGKVTEGGGKSLPGEAKLIVVCSRRSTVWISGSSSPPKRCGISTRPYLPVWALYHDSMEGVAVPRDRKSVV